MDTNTSTAQDELSDLIDFIQMNIMHRTNPSPITIPSSQEFILPEDEETLLMPLAVQGLLSLLDLAPDFDLAADQANSQLVDRFISDMNEEETPYKNVLSEEGEKVLRTIVFQEVGDTALNKECPIFQTKFQESQLVIQLPCNHCFDPDAIRHWLSSEKAECPICRYALPSKEIKNTSYDRDAEADE